MKGHDPDLLVFDLDPGAPATIVECCRVAEALRPALTAGQASDLALTFAQRLERELPRLVVSRMTKSARSGKVLIDWSQNGGSKTTIAPLLTTG